MSPPFEIQLQSKLLSAPAEIRYAIYENLIPDRIHAAVRKNSLRLSPCVQRERDGDAHCTYRRSDHLILNLDHRADPAFVRRLGSSWGEHWRCEEMQNGREMSANTLLRVCKRMSVDVAQWIADSVTIHVCDFNTLMVLEASSDGRALDHLTPSKLSQCILPNLKTLSISLRLPLATYEALENATSIGGSKISLVVAWTKLLKAIERMTSLRRLHIWLDHDEGSTWSKVNERAIVSPLACLRDIPNLDVSINLPRLHPKWETPERHFTEDSPASPLTIHRRNRQRYHVKRGWNGSLGWEHSPDFPILYDHEEWFGVSIEEIEELERQCWKKGGDVYKEFIQPFEPKCRISFIQDC